jgi:imidazolonepropionase-like amidohydrolase
VTTRTEEAAKVGPVRWCVTLACVAVLASCAASEPPYPIASIENGGFPRPAEELTSPPPGSSPLLLRHVTLVDGTGAAPREGVDILIVDGRVRAIGADLAAEGAVELPVAGQTVLPGLIDGHVHLQSVPGSILRGDTREMLELQQRLQLRAYLASGVTSVLDAAISASVLERLRALAEAGHPSPSIHSLSPYLTPTNGYFSSPEMRTGVFGDLWPPVEGSEHLDAQFRKAQALGPVGVKVTVEPGVVFDIYRMFTDDERDGIRAAAARHDAPIFVHSMSNEAHRRALTFDPKAFVHVGMHSEELEDDVAAAIAESGAFVVSTLAATSMESWTWRPELADEPWILMRVPEVQWETARHPGTLRRFLDVSAPSVAPRWIPTWAARVGATWVRGPEDGIREGVSSARAAKALVDRGVPLVMGSDAGNWPVFVTLFHGVASLLEMQLLEQAGIDRLEVLLSATSRAARMLGIEDQVGTVEVGKIADLVVVPKNPLEAGMVALTELSWVLKAGVANTPAGWLAADPSPAAPRTDLEETP